MKFLFLFLPFYTFGQALTATQVLDHFDESIYKLHQVDGIDELAPWQSWRLNPNLSYSIDLILNDEELQAFEMRLLDEDLQHYGTGQNVNSLNFVERCYIGQLQSPGLIQPALHFYKIVSPDFALDETVVPPYFGWYWRVINNMALACKVLPDGRYHISMAKFVKVAFNKTEKQFLTFILPSAVIKILQ